LKWLKSAVDEIDECIKTFMKTPDMEQAERLIKLMFEAKEKKMREEGFSQKRYLIPNCWRS